MKVLVGLFLALIGVVHAQEFEHKREYNFNDGNSGFFTGSNENIAGELVDGAYRFTHKRDKGSWNIWVGEHLHGQNDFEVSTDVRWHQGVTNQAFGFLFGTQDANNTFGFSISKTQYFRVWAYIHGTYKEIQGWTQKLDVIKADDWNSLMVRQEGITWRFYINGEEVYSCLAWYLRGPKVGFSISGNMTVDYDNLTVWTNSKPAIRVIKNPLTNVNKVNLGPNVNSVYTEINPVISADEQTLYVNRKNHPENSPRPNAEGKPYENDEIWISRRGRNGLWLPVERASAPLNNYGNNSVISVSPDGNSLIVNNTYSEDGSTLVGGGISITRKTADGTWGVPQKIEIKDFHNRHPKNYFTACLAPDRQALVIAAQRDSGLNSGDLYVCFRESATSFSKPMSLGLVVNTVGDEFAPFLAADGVTLYFSSYGHPGYGSADVFVTRRLDDTWQNWSEPENLGPGINDRTFNAYYSIPASGKLAYLVSGSSDENNSNDVFTIELAESARPNAVVLVKGVVYDSKTNAPLSAQIEYVNLQNNKTLGLAESDPVTGEYTIVLPFGVNYGFSASRDQYYPTSVNVDLTIIEEYKEIQRDLYLTPVESGAKVVLENVFFDTDKAVLRPESLAELQRLVAFLSARSNVLVEIAGHTDSRGNENHNLDLSKRRAQSVVNWLIEQGVEAERLSARGYGESQPRASNDSEEGRQLNRRVEFEIK